MPTIFKKITTRAKQIRKLHPNIKWQDAIRKASKEVSEVTSRAKKKHLHQTGSSNKFRDIAIKANPPGKRIVHHKRGKDTVYYEYRKNRSDMPGSLTGISESKLIGAIKERVQNKKKKTYVKMHNAKTKREKKELQKIITL